MLAEQGHYPRGFPGRCLCAGPVRIGTRTRLSRRRLPERDADPGGSVGWGSKSDSPSFSSRPLPETCLPGRKASEEPFPTPPLGSGPFPAREPHPALATFSLPARDPAPQPQADFPPAGSTGPQPRANPHTPPGVKGKALLTWIGPRGPSAQPRSCRGHESRALGFLSPLGVATEPRAAGP